MKFYKVHLLKHGSSCGFEFHTTKDDANKAHRKWKYEPPEPGSVDADSFNPEDFDTIITPIEIEPTKAGILAALRQHASHEANG